MGRQTGRRFRGGGKYTLRRILVVVAFAGAALGIGLLISNILENPVKETPQELLTPQKTLSLPAPRETPTPGLPQFLSVVSSTDEQLESIGFDYEIFVNKEPVDGFSRAEQVSFGADTEYTSLKGITTFGANNYRNSFTYGTPNVSEKSLEKLWESPTGSLKTESEGTYSGTGWTGMPIIIEWDATVRAMLAIRDEFKNKDGFTEVIYPAMDGNIYFFELESGQSTRDPIELGAVTKGTATIDPRGYPLLFTGQGVPDSVDGKGAWLRVISLIDNQVIWKFGGIDGFSYREWQAYDASPLICSDTDTLIMPGENGVLYTVKLNTSFDAVNKTVSVTPGELEKYKYTASGYGEDDGDRSYGIECSVSAFRNYLFFSDNGGLMQCVDANTLVPVYVIDVLDNSDSCAVIEEDVQSGTFYLYTANEIDTQPDMTDGTGKCVHRKLDGRTGETVWFTEHTASLGGFSSVGGTLSTPHVGRENISDLVIYNATLVPVTLNGETVNGGILIAYDKTTGREVWRHEQEAGYWSSPAVIYDENGDAYVLQCDREGMLTMHDARTGAVLTQLDLGSRIESTPAVYNDTLVVGTRGQHGSGDTQKIFAVRIK